MNESRLLVTPAEMRDYKSKREVLRDWNSGIKFALYGWQEKSDYITIDDVDKLKADGVTHIAFYYKRMKMKCYLKI